MVLKIYGVSDGPPSLSVRMTLKALNVPFELVPVNFNKGEHLTDAYAKLNPQKEIPVMDDDGFLLSEHIAIMQYVCDQYKPDSPLYPKEPKARAVINQRLCFNMAYYYSSIGGHALAPIFFDYERNPMGLKKVHMSLAVFEEYLKRSGTKYAAGNALTIADFPLITATMCLEAIDFSIDDYPLIKTWYSMFKSEHPDLFAIAEGGMKELAEFEKNRPILEMDHPLHPIRKAK